MGVERCTSRVGHYGRDDPGRGGQSVAALERASHHRLVLGWTAGTMASELLRLNVLVHVALLATDECLVHFHFAVEPVERSGRHREANAMQDEPVRLLC